MGDPRRHGVGPDPRVGTHPLVGYRLKENVATSAGPVKSR
jgi:hypothetical protein